MAEESYDVAVVGAGIMGSSAAYYAARTGAKVALLEQFHFLHRRGSSHGESRIIRYSYPSKAYTSLMIHSYNLWREAEEESGMQVLVETGGVDVIRQSLPIYKTLLDACEYANVPVEVLSSDELLAQYGVVFPETHVGVRQRSSGILHATTAVCMYQHLAAKHGAKLIDNAKIISRSTTASEPRLHTLHLADGRTITAKKVVFACGAWAKPMLEKCVGLHVPLKVWQTAVCYFKPKSDVPSAALQMRNMPVFIDYGNSPIWTSSTESLEPHEEPCIYSCPTREYPGWIKFAVHRGTDTTADDRTFEPDFEDCIKPVKSWLAAHVPFLDPEPVARETCLYTMTPDEDFIIDVHPDDASIVIAAGFSGHGFKFGSLVGRILSDLALTGKTAFDTSLFSLSRFK